MPRSQTSLLGEMTDNQDQQSIIRVAVPSPLYRTFHYLLNEEGDCLAAGCRVLVPFGRQKHVGIVIDSRFSTDPPPASSAKLKPIIKVLDKAPIIDHTSLSLCHWIADYYHHPIGEVLQQTLPTALRKAGSTQLATELCYALNTNKTESERDALLKRTTKQSEALAVIKQYEQISSAQLKANNISPPPSKPFWKKHLSSKRVYLATSSSQRQIGKQHPIHLPH